MKISYEVCAASLIVGDVMSISKLPINKSSIVKLKVGEEPAPEFMITKKNQEVEPMDSRVKSEYDEDIMSM